MTSQSETNSFRKFLTKYEVASLVGVRIEQLSFGSPSLLTEEDLNSCNNLQEIAELELKKKLLPFKISRTLPNNSEEILYLKDMIILA